MWHGYFGIENLALNDSQRGELVAALQALGPSSHPSPACLNHWRTRLDNQAVIFEAKFDPENLTIEAFKQRLGAIFGVSWVTIGHSVNRVTFDSLESAVVTFSRLGTDYLRVVFFGYDGTSWPTWLQSGEECSAYLAANAAEWGDGEL